MLLLIIRIIYAFVCAGAAAAFVRNTESAPPFVSDHPLITFFGLMLFSQTLTAIDLSIKRKRIEMISAIYFGLLIGVLLSFLLTLALEPIYEVVGGKHAFGWRFAITSLATAGFSYLSISLLIQTKDDFRFVIPFVEFSRELKGGRPLIIDSSALIDGRIAEVVETKIIDADIIVPGFVLREVQEIADSSDKGRRTRGRRGLDVLSKLQSIPHVDVEVEEFDEKEGQKTPVDEQLIKLAKDRGGRIITNDFNLNKVASVQGVDVINLNDVASALRPRFLPGDQLRVKIQREGESHGQGVGYLDDGTMVVCEQAASLMGQDIDAVVTSVLQSSAGRMIFARPQGVEPGPNEGRPHRSR
ncbi:MAG: PIN domain-containing protein [Planctomycetota bacterium]|jgi:uncharacterized protein YacL